MHNPPSSDAPIGLDRDSSSEIRQRWRNLVERDLPEAARDRKRGWPVRFDHCFARILLDNAHGRPWREVVDPPAWRNTSDEVLLRAIDLGKAVLEGRADLHALNQHSLYLRGKRGRFGTGNGRG